MAQTTKTWKLGEYAKGGVITVEIKGKLITIIGKEWDMSQGTRRSSNQTNAKEFTRGTALTTEQDARNKCMMFLEDLTTYYHACTIVEWIETKVKFEHILDW